MASQGTFSNFRIPELDNCCGCVTDIRTATAIIAVLGIVTCPLVSWAVVRHAYVIRVSCLVTTSSSRADVVDINLNNVLSFGFGANAGLGPSCMVKNATAVAALLREGTDTGIDKHSQFVNVVKFVGWIVLVTDFIFLIFSVNLLIKIFRGFGQQAAKYFILSGLAAVSVSFVYGMFYVSACLYMRGSFPVFEFVFALVDLLIWAMWLYFFLVVYTYSKPRPSVGPSGRLRKMIQSLKKAPKPRPKLIVWSYFLIVVYSYRRKPA